MITPPIPTTNIETSFGTETAPGSASLPVNQTITADISSGWTLVGLLVAFLWIAPGVIG